MEKATSVMSGLNGTISPQSIKDAFRLGKFIADSKKPRPLLVKFIRAIDATNILLLRGSLQNSSVQIKPDMSPMERKTQSILLKERWSLIQSGTPRTDIKIRGSRLLVRKKIHGQIRISGSTPLYVTRLEGENTAVHKTSPIVSTQSPQPVNNEPQSPSSPSTQLPGRLQQHYSRKSVTQNNPSCPSDISQYQHSSYTREANTSDSDQ